MSQEQVQRIRLSQFARSTTPQPTVAGELIVTETPDLRTQITRLYEEGIKEMPKLNGVIEEPASASSVVCPECGSGSVSQRHRTGIERALFSVTNHKAYTCRACGFSFYSRPHESDSGADRAGPSNAAGA